MAENIPDIREILYGVDASQGEYLPETELTVRFFNIYDLVDDRVVALSKVATGRSVDDAWANLCGEFAREVMDMSYDDYKGA